MPSENVKRAALKAESAITAFMLEAESSLWPEEEKALKRALTIVREKA